MSERKRERRQALALFFLAPVFAESLFGYDSTTGHPIELAFGLLFLAPLYGGAALLIRETARRMSLGWPGIALLAAAFGVFQAGVIDQSLFSSNYRDISYWEGQFRPTLVEPLGLSVFQSLAFVAGHVMWSMATPTAIVESLSLGARTSPWLGRVGVVSTVLVYLAGSALILIDHLANEKEHASIGQLLGALVVAGCLVAASFLKPAGRPTTGSLRLAPGPWPAMGATIVFIVAFNLLPATWIGVAGSIAMLVAAVVTIARWSRAANWTRTHIFSIAIGVSAGMTVVGLLIDPLGAVTTAQKYGHHAVAFVLIVLLAWWGARRIRALDEPSSASAPATPSR